MTEYYNHKQIADPVHGTIGLSKLEVEIINTRAFQRLRNIKQLGFAYYVFPAADYSRFIHSLGVCHITGRILSSLKKKDIDVPPEEMQRFRLAGLLHDIGHYPFSHALESPLKSHYKIDPDLILLDSNDNTKSKVKDGYWKHDKVGEEILVLDDDIRTIIEDCESDFNPVDISSIFLGNEKQFRGVVSSDLDADRIDYLLRTSLHTGLPYGAVDIDYLIGHMSLDKNQYICLDPRALRTAEHYLIARYFDYLQVSYHKSVMGFELLLERVISELLKSNLLKYSSEDIKKMMGDEWYTFDDSFLLREIKKKIGKLENKQVELMFRAIIERKPPKLIQKFDVVGKRFEFPRKKDEYPLRVEEDKLRLIIHDLAKEFKINKELWFIGSKEDHPVTFSNAYPIPDDEYKKDDDYTSALSKVVHIKSKNDDSKPIFESSESLLQLLSKHATFPLRLYVLFPEDMISQRNELAKDISQRVDSYISD